MTNNEIAALWSMQSHQCSLSDSLRTFARALLKLERAACIEACLAVPILTILGNNESYLNGQEIAVNYCVAAIHARNDLPTGE